MNMNILNFIKNINLSSIISGTNKTLNIVKKSIPVYREIRPYVNKEKTLFKKDNKPKEIDEIKMSRPLKSDTKANYNDTLTFFQ